MRRNWMSSLLLFVIPLISYTCLLQLRLAHAGQLQLDHKARQHRKLAAIPLNTCYKDVVPLQTVVPTISADVQPVMLTNSHFKASTNEVEHLRCESDHQQLNSIRWPRTYTGNSLKLTSVNYSRWTALKGSCSAENTVLGLTIVMARDSPLQHFGHRMLTDLPALFALRTYLVENGVDVRHVRVIFTDDLGLPSWGPDNFKPILQSLGYKSYEPLGHIIKEFCFDQVIFMPHYYFPKWYTNKKGQMMNMWKAPEKLYDTDPFHINMISQIRVALGLPREIPFAPATNQTVVLASRDPAIREKHGFRRMRMLMNEADLYKQLQAISGINVVQVEMGAMKMQDIVLLLDKTSIMLGYHGAAFDNLVFLPRAASVLEILPKGTMHPPLYPTLAHRTGKNFARYVNDDDARQVCYVDGVEKGGCLNHNANLVVDVGEVVQLVKSLLNVQQAAMTRHSFDEST